MATDEPGPVSASRLRDELGVTQKTARRMSRLIEDAPAELIRAVYDPLEDRGSAPIAEGPHRRRRARTAGEPVWAAGEIFTVAGDGTAGYGGDGGHAAAAQLNYPFGVAVDRSGNLWIGDEQNHVVRMVDVGGTITTVAGTGVAGYSGDGGAARDAELDQPQAITIDGDGNVLVADVGNHVVRKIDPDGMISTFAGCGAPGLSGDGGPATQACFNGAGTALPVEDGFLIADYANHRVRKVDRAGIVTTIAGTGEDVSTGDGGPALEAGVPRPGGLAADHDGNLYVAQVGPPNCADHRVRKIDPSGTISTFVGGDLGGFSGDGGPASDAWLFAPTGLLFEPELGLLICEYFNNRVRLVDRSGTVSTLVGSGRAGFSGNGGRAARAMLYRPLSIARNRVGDLFVTDSHNHRVRSVRGLLPPER